MKNNRHLALILVAGVLVSAAACNSRGAPLKNRDAAADQPPQGGGTGSGAGGGAGISGTAASGGAGTTGGSPTAGTSGNATGGAGGLSTTGSGGTAGTSGGGGVMSATGGTIASAGATSTAGGATATAGGSIATGGIPVTGGLPSTGGVAGRKTGFGGSGGAATSSATGGAASTGGTTGSAGGSGGAGGSSSAAGGTDGGGSSADAGLCGGEYTACGCGCCGAYAPRRLCYYPALGETFDSIVAADRAAAASPICAFAGCNLGTQYICCVAAPPESPGSATYAATGTSTALDRIRVVKTDGDAMCTTLELATPTTSSTAFRITLPARWGIEGAFRAPCAAGTPIENAMGDIGSASFQSIAGACVLDLHVTLFFGTTTLEAVPLDTTGLTITGIVPNCR